MKLSEALAQRADLQKRIQQLIERAKMSAIFQQGTQPPEDADALLKELEGLCEELETLIQRINRTNSATVLGEEGTISDAIAMRDVLKIRADALRQVADAAIVTSRHGRSEILYLTKINVRARRQEIDQIMKLHRVVDQSIQAANWTTELLQ